MVDTEKIKKAPPITQSTGLVISISSGMVVYCDTINSPPNNRTIIDSMFQTQLKFNAERKIDEIFDKSPEPERFAVNVLTAIEMEKTGIIKNIYKLRTICETASDFQSMCSTKLKNKYQAPIATEPCMINGKETLKMVLKQVHLYRNLRYHGYFSEKNFL